MDQDVLLLILIFAPVSSTLSYSNSQRQLERLALKKLFKELENLKIGEWSLDDVARDLDKSTLRALYNSLSSQQRTILELAVKGDPHYLLHHPRVAEILTNIDFSSLEARDLVQMIDQWRRLNPPLLQWRATLQGLALTIICALVLGVAMYNTHDGQFDYWDLLIKEPEEYRQSRNPFVHWFCLSMLTIFAAAYRSNISVFQGVFTYTVSYLLINLILIPFGFDISIAFERNLFLFLFIGMFALFLASSIHFSGKTGRSDWKF